MNDCTFDREKLSKTEFKEDEYIVLTVGHGRKIKSLDFDKKSIGISVEDSSIIDKDEFIEKLEKHIIYI